MSATGGVLALDLASVIGFAYGLPTDERPLCGAWRLPNASISEGGYFAAAENEFCDALTVHRPRLVVFEAPLFVGQHLSTQAMNLLVGLKAIIQCNAWRHDVECRPVASSTARAKVLGTARFPKGEAKAHVTAWVESRGITVATHDAADAVVLWFHAVGFRAAGREAA
jgi:hypothetical protein